MSWIATACVNALTAGGMPGWFVEVNDVAWERLG